MKIISFFAFFALMIASLFGCTERYDPIAMGKDLYSCKGDSCFFITSEDRYDYLGDPLLDLLGIPSDNYVYSLLLSKELTVPYEVVLISCSADTYLELSDLSSIRSSLVLSSFPEAELYVGYCGGVFIHAIAQKGDESISRLKRSLK